MKEEFDDILKRKWEEQHFPVDEGHREQMIALLDRNKRRKLMPIWWLGGLGMAAFFAGYFLLSSGESIPTSLSKPAVEEYSAHESSKNNLPLGENRIEENQVSSTAKHKENNADASASVVPSATPPANASITPKSNPLEKNASHAIKQSSKVDKTRQESEPMTIGKEAPSSEPTGIGAKPKDIYQVDEEDVRSFQIVSKSAAVTIEPATRYDVLVEDIMLPDFTGIDYSRNDLPAKITPNTAFDKSFYVFGETGVGMIFASQPDFTSGWKFRAGGGVGYKMCPKVQLTLSVGYLLQDGGFDFQRSSTVNHASFGTRSSFNTLTPDKLHYVYSRIGAQYRLSRHIIGVHGGVQYLYGSQGELVTQVQDQFASGTTESSEYTWLVTDGLRKMNWTAAVSYGYQLTPRLFASAGADFYFTPITIEDDELANDGYYWSGAYAPVHPFITLNYLIYAVR